MGLAPLFCLRWCSAHRRTVFLRRCIAAALVASGATLLLFQTKLAAHESMLLPPWIRPSAGPPGRQEEREGRTERDRRIMERQIFRDSGDADHRHDGGVQSSASRKRLWFFTNGTEWPRPSSRLSRLARVWPDPKAPHDDRIVAQLMYLPPRYKGQATNLSTTYNKSSNFDWRNDSNATGLKTILLRGSWYNFHEGRMLFLRDRCPVDACRVYKGWRNENITVDAVIHKDSFYNFYPKPRRQLWILYLLENPLHTSVGNDSGSIDITATYRKDSDIVTPYEKFVLFDPLVKTIKRDIDYAQNKTKMVAWFVSNCHAANRRLDYAKNLGKHIQVDIYGTCGPLSCPRHKSEQCYRMLDNDYRFYLAFENANCKDYITEKFFNALRHNVIPVVMGARREDYLAAAPYHSYIHVEDFASPKELAEYLLLLSRNRTLYNEYFHWRGTGEFVNTYFWCRLCAMLHAPPPPRGRRTRNVSQWWKDGACAAPKKPA
ncbi:hypothetical protein HPB48_018411 [Haemaphysalis longicornis]|uniref:Fucosyltransferase n=1 Tax=Haemaphysalis longicornis TaxID=44386 RepID=A0A9J6G4N4_HAELO|nr:hypothetical protein HPB48_018411 [Haemaphysalis longicornis]